MSQEPPGGDATGPEGARGDPTRAHVPSPCAIVVTYEPDGGIAERLARVASQCDRVVVVDNGSAAAMLERLDAVETSLENLEVIRLGANLGVGCALNAGARRAIALGHDVLCTFDQDTVVHERYARSMLDCLRVQGSRAALIGCNYNDLARGRARHSPAGRGCVERTTVITSGSLFASSLYLRAGPFAEDYFIDSVDHEYCLRVRACGARVVLNREVLLDHGIGEPGGRRGLAARLSPYAHPPARRYFAVRNTLWTVRRYGRRESRWACRQLLRLCAELTGDALSGPRRGRALASFAAGVLDGVIRVPGSARVRHARP